MSVSATATSELNVDQLIETSLQLAGFLNPGHPADPNLLLLGRRVLLLGLRALSNDGIILRARERASVTLTAGTAYADMATDTLSVEQGATLKNSDGTIDRQITLIGMEQYQALPNKTVSGTPNFYYPEKQSNGVWRVYFYPVPTTDFPTFVVPRTRKLRDVDTGVDNIDLEDKYHLAIVKFLSAELAGSKGRWSIKKAERGDYLAELARAENDETPRGNLQFEMPDSPWD